MKEQLKAKIKNLGSCICALAAERDDCQKKLDELEKADLEAEEQRKKREEKEALKRASADIMEMLDRRYCLHNACRDCPYATDHPISVDVKVGAISHCVFEAFRRITEQAFAND